MCMGEPTKHARHCQGLWHPALLEFNYFIHQLTRHHMLCLSLANLLTITRQFSVARHLIFIHLWEKNIWGAYDIKWKTQCAIHICYIKAHRSHCFPLYWECLVIDANERKTDRSTDRKTWYLWIFTLRLHLDKERNKMISFVLLATGKVCILFI